MTTATGRAAHSRYAEVISMWVSKFNTAEIAESIGLKEHIVARWVANYQNMMHGAA